MHQRRTAKGRWVMAEAVALGHWHPHARERARGVEHHGIAQRLSCDVYVVPPAHVRIGDYTLFRCTRFALCRNLRHIVAGQTLTCTSLLLVGAHNASAELGSPSTRRPLSSPGTNRTEETFRSVSKEMNTKLAIGAVLSPLH